MMYRTVVLYIYFLIFVALDLVRMDTININFNINVELENYTMLCDHTQAKIKENKYTVLEGEEMIISITNGYILIRCTELHDSNKIFFYAPHHIIGRKSSVTVTKEMGSSWNCSILSRINEMMKTTYCYLQLRVRKKSSPQTILVNNMVVHQVRTDLSEKEVDYTVDYEYAEGDLVKITCTAFETVGQFTMQFNYADRLSDKFNSTSITSNTGIAVRAKLNSGHHNIHMICLFKESYDETRVRITFLMRSEFKHFVLLYINDMLLRPKPEPNTRFNIEYIYVPSQKVNVVCHVEQPELNLTIQDTAISKDDCYKKNVRNSNRSVRVKFCENSKLMMNCAADYVRKNCYAESTSIHFTPQYRLADNRPLHMNLPLSGIVMELYENSKRYVIYYEFEEGEVLTLNCYASTDRAGPFITYLKFSDSDDTDRSNIIQTIQLSSGHEGTVKTCYMLEVSDDKTENDTICGEVTVIFFRQKVTTSTSTIAPAELSEVDYSKDSTIFYVETAGVIIFIIIFISLIVVLIKKRCCLTSNRPLPAPTIDPSTVFYLNLLEIFRPMNERELQDEEHHYEEIL